MLARDVASPLDGKSRGATARRAMSGMSDLICEIIMPIAHRDVASEKMRLSAQIPAQSKRAYR
ncbi:MAG: hypothetical protein KGM94_08005 [Bradyrhizobium sp.]|nr:hypothetical protein [Bradyrhizobium sp.]